jgi:hypothetical protein
VEIKDIFREKILDLERTAHLPVKKKAEDCRRAYFLFFKTLQEVKKVHVRLKEKYKSGQNEVSDYISRTKALISSLEKEDKRDLKVFMAEFENKAKKMDMSNNTIDQFYSKLLNFKTADLEKNLASLLTADSKESASAALCALRDYLSGLLKGPLTGLFQSLDGTIRDISAYVRNDSRSASGNEIYLFSLDKWTECLEFLRAEYDLFADIQIEILDNEFRS